MQKCAVLYSKYAEVYMLHMLHLYALPTLRRWCQRPPRHWVCGQCGNYDADLNHWNLFYWYEARSPDRPGSARRAASGARSPGLSAATRVVWLRPRGGQPDESRGRGLAMDGRGGHRRREVRRLLTGSRGGLRSLAASCWRFRVRVAHILRMRHWQEFRNSGYEPEFGPEVMSWRGAAGLQSSIRRRLDNWAMLRTIGPVP